MDNRTVDIIQSAKAAREAVKKIEKLCGTTVTGQDIDEIRATQARMYSQLQSQINNEGASSYNSLSNKPSINNIVLQGEKSLTQLGAASNTEVAELRTGLATASQTMTTSLTQMQQEMLASQAAINTRFDNLTSEMTTALDGLNATDAGFRTSITNIESKIPSSASSTNQLADVDTVKELVAAGAARGLSADENGNGFSSYDALVAGPWYNVGVETDPVKNDYAVVKKDASHNNHDTRYNYDGAVWVFYQEFSGDGFTPTTAQTLAMDSGITADKVTGYDAAIGTVTSAVTELKAKNTELFAAIAKETTDRNAAVQELRSADDTERLARENGDNQNAVLIQALTDRIDALEARMPMQKYLNVVTTENLVFKSGEKKYLSIANTNLTAADIIIEHDMTDANNTLTDYDYSTSGIEFTDITTGGVQLGYLYRGGNGRAAIKLSYASTGATIGVLYIATSYSVSMESSINWIGWV